MKKLNIKIINFCLIAFSILFLIFPLYLTAFNIEFSVMSVSFILMILLLINRNKLKFMNSKFTPLYLFLFCFIIRVLIIFLFRSSIMQVSDFGYVYQSGVNKAFAGDLAYYATATHYILYSKIVMILFSIFGNHATIVYLFNAFLLSFIPVLMFYISKVMFKKGEIGCIGGILYSLWPGAIFYNMLLTPDHIASVLITLVVFLAVYLLNNIEKIKLNKESIKYFVIALSLGIVTALVIFFKNFALVILLSFIIVMILGILKSKKNWKNFLLIFLTIMISYSCAKNVVFMYCDHLFDTKVSRNSAIYYAYVGLGVENNGVYSAEKYGEIYDYFYNSNHDYKAMNKHFLKKVGEGLKNNLKSYPYLFYRKGTVITASDNAPLNWFESSLTNKGLTLITGVVKKLNNDFYAIIIIGMILFTLYNLSNKKDLKPYFILITIFGSLLMLLIVEAQGRYKYAIEPLMIFIAAAGLYYMKDLFLKFKSDKGE